MEYKILLGILIGIAILYKLLNRPDNKLEKDINEILTSDKYKVKGQYD
jgi:hypothetical protein